jgi:hypothetical protein
MLGEERIRKILKERRIEWNGVRVKARDRERWKAFCVPSLYTLKRFDDGV